MSLRDPKSNTAVFPRKSCLEAVAVSRGRDTFLEYKLLRKVVVPKVTVVAAGKLLAAKA